VYFSSIDEDVVVDVIPIVEIVEVNKVSEEVGTSKLPSELHKDKNMISKDPQIVNVTAIQCRFQIMTDQDGYNSGRKYVLQASSDEMCELVIQELVKLSKIEKKRAERRSKFERTQAKVKRFFLSNSFHVLMSSMILVVSTHT
jgi:hypothetical protein